MTKTNEFRIKENKGVFTVERKCINVFDHWHTYHLTDIDSLPFIYNDKVVDEMKCECPSVLKFDSLDSAKEFIANELKAEERPKEETIIYHQYP